MKQNLSNFDSTPQTCDPNPFPGKNIPNIAKSYRIFPGKGREDKTSFWHIWVAHWLKFFRTTAYFFDFGHVQEQKRGQNWTKSANLGLVLFQ